MNHAPVVLFDELKKDFVLHANPNSAIAMKAYMKDKFDMYGIKTPIRKDILKPYYPEVKSLNKNDFIELIKLLWAGKQRDYQYTAMEFLQRNKKKLDVSDIPFIEGLLIAKPWWDSIDMLASHMVGHLFKDDIDTRNIWVEKWMASDNMWLQRTCLIFQLKYANEIDLDLLKACLLLNLGGIV